MNKALKKFSDTFLFQYVSIVLGTSMTLNIADEEGHHENHITPVTIEGYILDMDDVFIFLGATPDFASRAFPIANLKFIEILDPPDELKDILQSVSGDREKMN